MTTPAIFAGMMGSSQGVDIGDNIANSLMLDSSASQSLSWTPSGAGNRKTATIHIKFKLGKLGTVRNLFYAYGSDADTGLFNVYLDTDDKLKINAYTFVLRVTTKVWRDPIGWNYLTIALDTTQATANSRLRLYDGLNEITVFDQINNFAQNADTALLNNVLHTIGRNARNNNEFFDGYHAQVLIIGGSQLDGSAFLRQSSDTLQFVNKNYSGSFAGTNSCKLDFTNGSALGTDSSGNGNNWTVNGGITSANQYTDTPTNNYAVWNGVCKKGNYTSSPLSKGNTATVSASHGAAYGSIVPTMPVYWEVAITSANSMIGMIALDGSNGTYSYDSSGAYGIYPNSTQIVQAGSFSAGPYSGTGTYMFAFDPVSRKLWVGKSGTWTGDPVAGTGNTFTLPAFTQWVPWTHDAGAANIATANFGARPFAHTPPTGFKALCTANIPEGTAAAPASFTGNASVDGTYVPMNGTPETATINSNAVTWGTHADRTAGGMKLRTSSSSYNASGSNTLSCTFLSPNRKSVQKYQTAKGNP